MRLAALSRLVHLRSRSSSASDSINLAWHIVMTPAARLSPVSGLRTTSLPVPILRGWLIMRYKPALVTMMVVCASSGVAFAHGGIGDEGDLGQGIFWLYGIVFAGLAGLILYKVIGGRNETPERKELRRRLAELEHGLKSRSKELQNAEEYPLECGLSDEQRQQLSESVAAIHQLIEETKSKLLQH